MDGDRSPAARAQVAVEAVLERCARSGRTAATVAADARPWFGCMDAMGAARLGRVACAVVTRLSSQTAPASPDFGPLGVHSALGAREIGPNIKHVIADGGFTGIPRFATALREAGFEVHMKYPAPQIAAGPREMFFEHRDGTVATVLEHCGSFYHEWMPKDLWYPPKDASAEELAEWHARRLPWRYDVAESFDDGSKKMKCPFHAGKLYNPKLAGSPKRRGSAQFTAVPKGATSCCNGTFIAKPIRPASDVSVRLGWGLR